MQALQPPATTTYLARLGGQLKYLCLIYQGEQNEVPARLFNC